jgi:hypothetical protein
MNKQVLTELVEGLKETLRIAHNLFTVEPTDFHAAYLRCATNAHNAAAELLALKENEAK